MTNPVILLGTQSNGETLPVQVDATGRLVAEGLQGEQGEQGIQGPPGPPGPSGEMELPPDPYEGALLGWLNGELAWIGTPPVPVPDDLFGPIADWDSDNNLLTVEGTLPPDIGNGVYVYQVDAAGNRFVAGWNVSALWRNMCVGGYGDPYNSDKAFNSVIDDYNNGWYAAGGGYIQFTPNLQNISVIKVYAAASGTGGSLEVNGNPVALNKGQDGTTVDVYTIPTTFFNSLRHVRGAGSDYLSITGIEVDGRLLVDSDWSLNMRVNQRFTESTLLGVTSPAGVDFTVGQYLRTFDQRVAPWVLYGNDPTSLIDHLRQTRD